MLPCVSTCFLKTEEPDAEIRNRHMATITRLQAQEKLLLTFDDCLSDPITHKPMTNPCVAPDGYSYEVDPATMPADKTFTRVSLKLREESTRGNHVLYRNYALKNHGEFPVEKELPTPAHLTPH